MSKHIRNGLGALRPYLYCRPDMVGFVEHVFGATITSRDNTPIGEHVEAVIGDSALVMETAEKFPDGIAPTVASVYLYVENVDEVFARAMASNAVVLSEPEDKPYDERQCGFQDSFGNTWWVATHNDARN